MSLENFQQVLIPMIETELQALIDSQEFGRSQDLKKMLTYHMGWTDGNGGGKRIRPLLTLLCAGAFGEKSETALPGAISIELLHNFTLIHDDIEDRSPYRHKRPTLWTEWGIPQAINAGDALFSVAQIAMLSMAETCDHTAAVAGARQLNRVCLRLTRGQHLDIAFETQRAVGVTAYLDMIGGKTAALIGFSAWVGGLAAHQSDKVLGLLSDFGESLGMAFQIQDDSLGIWGNPAVTGKSAASDLLAKKKTLPVLYGQEHCAEFRTLWDETQTTPDQVAHMAALLEECGAQTYTQSQAQIFTQRAFTCLDNLFPKQNAYAEALFELTGKLLHRDF